MKNNIPIAPVAIDRSRKRFVATSATIIRPMAPKRSDQAARLKKSHHRTTAKPRRAPPAPLRSGHRARCGEGKPEQQLQHRDGHARPQPERLPSSRFVRLRHSHIRLYSLYRQFVPFFSLERASGPTALCYPLRMSRLLLIALLAGLASLPLLAEDISGNWEFNVETAAGSGSPSFVFKQDGEKITGTYSGLVRQGRLDRHCQRGPDRFQIRLQLLGAKRGGALHRDHREQQEDEREGRNRRVGRGNLDRRETVACADDRLRHVLYSSRKFTSTVAATVTGLPSL